MHSTEAVLSQDLPQLSRRVRLCGTVRVPTAPKPALLLFTPRGEKSWAEGWDPQFPAPTDDDSEPGSVFEIVHAGRPATWIVCGGDPERSIRYARIDSGKSAGMITVTVDPSPEGSVATVEYDLTALSDNAAAELVTFASHYEHFLASWERAIATALAPSERESVHESPGSSDGTL